MKRKLYKKGDKERVVAIRGRPDFAVEPYRSPWRRDYGRVIHSAAFRRLQGKTQLFPNYESDFFRNRLTHSLEVAQVAKSIAIRINSTIPAFQDNNIDTDIVELAGLIHDLGHPPFGHIGENALDECMKDDGGFEGNAQSLRVVAKLEKRQTRVSRDDAPIVVNDSGNDCRAGLNLAYRTLASVLKYDREIPRLSKYRKEKGVNKGYYYTEKDLVNTIKQKVTGTNGYTDTFKTIECSIMDIADDIAYSTYDLEDAFKAGFLSPLRMISGSDELLKRVSDKVEDRLKTNYENLAKNELTCTPDDVLIILLEIFGEIFDFDIENVDLGELFEVNNIVASAIVASEAFRTSDSVAKIGYFRTDLTSRLVGKFIRGVEVEVKEQFPALSKAFLNIDVFKKVEVLKNYSYEALIISPMLKVAEHRGEDIVKKIFKALDSDAGQFLLPDDFRYLYENLDDPSQKRRTVCDFIAGMTDRYALEFHGRLYSATAESIWKPI